MDSAWPWLAIAGSGALHGVNPATGWMFAAAWALRSGDRGRAVAALLPLAAGHVAAVALVGAAVALGVSLDRVLMQTLAVGLLVVGALVHWSGHMPNVARAPAGHAGLALWSFLMATVHGAGLMLVPALMSLCTGAASPTGPGIAAPWLMALAGVAVHTAAMLAVTGAIASGVCRGVAAGAGVFGRRRGRPATGKRDGPAVG